MFIPKGTICTANVWHLNLDPDIYGKDVTHFNPARYLYANGEIAPGTQDAKKRATSRMALVADRVSCSEQLAIHQHYNRFGGAQTRANERPHRPTSSLGWMWTAQWKLVLSCEYDSSCDPETRITREDAVTSHPFPHECDITPRFRKLPLSLHAR
ncbi:hypothetical protein EDB89DRAFT_1967199 [Lactarius sanguifluus]|nr:hypothetical protein EDB89DRAFT_1967199 [Lactarius sanguifluus]